MWVVLDLFLLGVAEGVDFSKSGKDWIKVLSMMVG